LSVLSDQRFESPQFALHGFSAVNCDSNGLFVATHQPCFDYRVRIAPVLDGKYCLGGDLLYLGEREISHRAKPPFYDRGLYSPDARAGLNVVSDLPAPDADAQTSGIINGELAFFAGVALFAGVSQQVLRQRIPLICHFQGSLGIHGDTQTWRTEAHSSSGQFRDSE
jgi:hypothetical protein